MSTADFGVDAVESTDTTDYVESKLRVTSSIYGYPDYTLGVEVSLEKHKSFTHSLVEDRESVPLCPNIL